MVVDNSTNNSSSNINKISVFGKGNTVFTDPKDRQVKHYYPNKKTVVTLSIESGQKEFLRVRRNQHIFLLSTWNLYLREIIFVTDVAGADLGGGCRGCAPPSPPEMTCGFQYNWYSAKKTMRFIGVEVEQETSAPPPKKNPGSAPEL